MEYKTVEEYLALPYTIEVVYDNSGEEAGYVARVVEWGGCLTQADTWAELGEMVEDAMRCWVEVCIEDGLEIPAPRGMA